MESEKTETNQKDIGLLLRRTREGLDPEEFGFANGSRRRTKGLRREEVAHLSGISTEWYTRLEQGRDVHASFETLERISKAVGMSTGDTSLLFKLSGYSSELDDNRTISHSLQAFLDQQYPSPAYITDKRWQMLAWNEATKLLFEDLDTLAGPRRNALFNMFLSERYKQMLVDWHYHARGVVSTLRALVPKNKDADFDSLIETLKSESQEFREIWEEREIAPYQDGFKSYNHPEVGRLNFEYVTLNSAAAEFTHLNILVFLPNDTATEERLGQLLG